VDGVLRGGLHEDLVAPCLVDHFSLAYPCWDFEWSVICNDLVTRIFNKINKGLYASIDAEAGDAPFRRKKSPQNYLESKNHIFIENNTLRIKLIQYKSKTRVYSLYSFLIVRKILSHQNLTSINEDSGNTDLRS
jgi:hypothetical protein